MTFSSEIIFVRVLLPFVIGICCAYPIENRQFLFPLFIINLFLFAILIIINVLYKKLKAYRFKEKIGLFVYLFSFFFGGLICLLHKQSLRADYYANTPTEYFKSYINSEPQHTNGILRFEVAVTHLFTAKQIKTASGKILISVKLDTLQIGRAHV